MYEDINDDHLKTITRDKSNKVKSATDCDVTMLQFFYTKKNIFYHIKEKMKLYELSLWLKSMKNYLNRKDDYSNHLYTNKRKILYIDFGFGIGSELAYEHPCVVIDMHYDNIFVVPCSTGQLARARNEDGTVRKGYMITDCSNGFTKETALILHGARWISKRRIVRDTRKKVTPDFFQNLKRELLKVTLKSEYSYIEELESKINHYIKAFDTISIENDNLMKDISTLKTVNKDLLTKLDAYITTS